MNKGEEISDIFYQLSKWGNYKPKHVKITPELLEFLFRILDIQSK